MDKLFIFFIKKKKKKKKKEFENGGLISAYLCIQTKQRNPTSFNIIITK